MTDPRITIQTNRSRFGVFSWQGQALQYDQLGPPGEVVYWQFTEDSTLGAASAKLGTRIDALLYYDEYGALAGILNHYPDGARECDGTLLERPGNINMFIRPGPQEVEATEALADEGVRRWPEANGSDLKLALGEGPLRQTTMGDLMDGNHRIMRLMDGNHRIMRLRDLNR